MEVAWKLLALLSAAVACQFALLQVLDRLRARRRRERQRPHRPPDDATSFG